MQPYPHYPERWNLDLGGIWDFSFIPGNEAPGLDSFSPEGVVFRGKEIVPGVFDATAPLAGKRGVGVYRRTVELPEDGKYLLSFEGFLLSAAIFWDGERIASSVLPYSPLEATVAACRGKHELLVAVDNRFSATPMWLDYYDFYAYGGIARPCSVSLLGECAIIRANVKTLSPDGRVLLEIRMRPGCAGEIPISVSFDGGEETIRTVRLCESAARLEFGLDGFAPWTPENPVLHTVRVSTPSDAIVERFGIRQIECKDGRILLNGKEIRLFGYNRHSMHPDLGAAVSPAVHLQDLKILKDLGCNFIRGSHYPQDQRFLDMCDEMGFLVWEEALAWANQENQLKDGEFCRLQLEQVSIMVEKSINHPSVIIWGFLNECGSDSPHSRALISSLAKQIGLLDGSRPVSYASNRFEKDVSLDLVDIISFNPYPGWYGVGCDEPHPLDAVERRLKELEEFSLREEYAGKPLIISEIGAAAIYGCHDRLASQWTEEYQSALLARVLDWCISSKRISGLAMWMLTDTRTYVCGQSRPRGHNNKGTLDEYRRPKLAYEAVKGKLEAMRGKCGFPAREDA